MSNKIFVVVPAFGQMISASTFMAVSALQAALASKSIQAAVTTFSFPDIAELRSIFTTIWYDTMPDTDSILWVDADMAFAPDLVLDMMLFGEPVVGTLYRQRNAEISWAGSGTGSATTERRGNFVLVEGVGMGCTLIRREVITRILAAFPDLIDMRIRMHPAFKLLQSAGVTRLLRVFEKLDIPDRGLVSEDLSFCIRWNRVGGQVWANIGHRISHVGPYDYSGCYAEHVSQIEAQKELERAHAEGILAVSKALEAPSPKGGNGADLSGQSALPVPTVEYGDLVDRHTSA